MKTAVILYGFFRNFNYIRHTFKKHVMDATNCDVFFSTPDTIWTKKEDELVTSHHCFSINNDMFDEKEIVNFFGSNLKNHEVRKYDSKFYKDFVKENNLPEYNDFVRQFGWRVLSSIHSFSLSVDIFKKYVEKTGEKYDAVIITRPDIRYYTDFNTSAIKLDYINCNSHFTIDPNHPELKKFPPFKRKYEINLRKRNGGAGIHGLKDSIYKNNQLWINDNIITGNQENILNLVNFFDKSPEYIDEGICFNYETLLGFHIYKNGMLLNNSNHCVYELWRELSAEYK